MPTAKSTKRVGIIGGGFSGIAAAQRLKKYGIEDFVLFEKSASVGGTWFDNIYPGAEVDTPSHIYSFSFNQNDWTRTHVAQAELLAYLKRTVDELGLERHLRLSTPVRALDWVEAESRWKVTLDEGEVEYFDAIISAVGFLNVPNIPDWAKGTDFAGDVIHSARWPEGYDLTGKKVGVVGTGSTAVQIVTEAAKVAEELTVFQREPNWVFPKGNRPYTERERKMYRSFIGHKLHRLRHFLTYEAERFGGRNQIAGTRGNTKLRKAAEAFIARELKDRPELIEKVTPSYPIWGKRLVFCDTYYSSLAKPNVRLAPQVTRMDASGVVDAEGMRHEVDTLVLATGFTATQYLSTLAIRGRGAYDLHEVWGEEPEALAGVAVPGFPNFFMMYGPNTNSGPLVFLLECEAEFAARCIAGLGKNGVVEVEADVQATRKYNDWIQAKLSKMVWSTSNNYFRSPTGKVVTQWPFTVSAFWLASRKWRRRGMKRLTKATNQRRDVRITQLGEQS